MERKRQSKKSIQNSGTYKSSLQTESYDEMMLSQLDDAQPGHTEFYGQYFVVRPLLGNSEHDENAHLQFLAKIEDPNELEAAQDVVNTFLTDQTTKHIRSVRNSTRKKIGQAVKIPASLINHELKNI